MSVIHGTLTMHHTSPRYDEHQIIPHHITSHHTTLIISYHTISHRITPPSLYHTTPHHPYPTAPYHITSYHHTISHHITSPPPLHILSNHIPHHLLPLSQAVSSNNSNNKKTSYRKKTSSKSRVRLQVYLHNYDLECHPHNYVLCVLLTVTHTANYDSNISILTMKMMTS